MKILKLLNHPSPKGFDYDAHLQKIGTLMVGRDGKLWIVKQYNTKRWVVSEFYKEYKQAEKKLIKLLKIVL